MAHNLTDLVPTEAGTRFFDGSEQSAFGKTQCATVRDDDVIEHSDVDQAQRIAEPVGDELVCLAGLSDAAGVIMSQNDGCRLVPRGLDDDFAWVNAAELSRIARSTTRRARAARAQGLDSENDAV